MFNKKLVFISLLFTIILGIMFLLLSKVNKEAKKLSLEERLTLLSSGNEDIFPTFLDQVSSIIYTEGIDGAIKLTELALKKEKINIGQCHDLLHIIGHVAFQKYPNHLEFLARHDSNICLAGFQHGVEAQIAIDNPISAELLKRYCYTLRNIIPDIWCYHGAGHAYLQITGDVNNALDKCDSLDGGIKIDLEDCYRGVFSEYRRWALGYDQDTGKSFPAGPRVKLDLDNPYSFCKSLEENYRPACYYQMTKVYVKYADLKDSLEKCLKVSDLEVQQICVYVASRGYARTTILKTNYIKTPEILISMPQSLRHEYIKGVKEAFIGYQLSGIEKDWQTTCSSLTIKEDRRFCNSL